MRIIEIIIRTGLWLNLQFQQNYLSFKKNKEENIDNVL